jgi:hypothetical protein
LPQPCTKKVNPFCTFAIEQSGYGTRLEPGAHDTIAGKPSSLWPDHRTELGPIFTLPVPRRHGNKSVPALAAKRQPAVDQNDTMPGFKRLEGTMVACHNPLRLLPTLILLNAMLVATAFAAERASQAHLLQIKVLSAVYHALNEQTQVPKDCDFQNYSSYCIKSRSPSGQNMLVQDADGGSFTIACTADSRWPKCASLPVGETFDVRKEEHGITTLYRNARGKDQSRYYQLAAAGEVLAAQSAPAAHSESHAAASLPSSPRPASIPRLARCRKSFRRTRRYVAVLVRHAPGAEITLDGNYAGNTSSAIALGTGAHVIVLFYAGLYRAEA